MADRQRRWTRWLLEISLVIAVITAIGAWQARDATRGPAPDFAGTLLDGTAFALSDLRGRPALVHFWASWCPVCGLEQGSIDALARDHQVITVAIDAADAETVGAWLAERGVDYPVMHDPGYRVARRYGVRAVPTSFVLDPDGRIRFVLTGYTPAAGFRARLWWAGR